MKIIVGHPNTSYVQATKQMLQAQDFTYEIQGAVSLSELVDYVSNNSYDIILVDTELAAGNPQTFFKVLGTIKHQSRIIISLQKDEKEILQMAGEYGISDCIVKTEGYLLSLANIIKETKEQQQAHYSEYSNTTEDWTRDKESYSSEQKELTENETRGQLDDEGFVCDRRGHFLSVDDHILHVSKYTRDELLKLSILDIVDQSEHDNFLRELFDNALRQPAPPLNVRIVDKFGEKKYARIQLRSLRDDSQEGHVIGFRGYVSQITEQESSATLQKNTIDQNKMVAELVDLVNLSYSEPLYHFLQRIAELTSQIFKFERSTVALLDRQKKSYIKQVMVGYSEEDHYESEKRSLEVPREVIDRIFEEHYRIKVIYYNQDSQQRVREDQPGTPERRSQRRRPLKQWHQKDLVLMNLTDHNNVTFGYVSLDHPVKGSIPTRSTFYNLELFSRLVSMSIENYYRFNALERKNRRLKQMLASSDIFKLQLSLTELLNEVVWSAKNTLDFNLVSLALISKKSQMLETKAVACEDRIKQLQINELSFNLQNFSDLLQDEYSFSKSYLISREESVLRHVKRIYYGADVNIRYGDGWPNWAVLLVPIKSGDGKIIGFFLADDPQNRRMPGLETVRILEIMANQVAVAIDNRMMYVQARDKAQYAERTQTEYTKEEMAKDTPHDHHQGLSAEEIEDRELGNTGFRKMVERFLR